MDWMRIGVAIVTAGIAGSLADWLFGGVLWHEKYLAYPEVWRRSQGGGGENKAILWATVLTFFTAGVFILLCARLGLHGLAAFKLAFVLWLAIPLPQLIVQALFVKIHPLITTAHSMGWLARLLIAATATLLF